MTEGKISKAIIFFALPLLLGQLFQQLYNVVDSLVVGNVVGEVALAAVTSTGSIIFLILGFLRGVFIGSSVIISQYFGAKDDKNVRIAIHTTIAVSFIAGLLVVALGVIGTPYFLVWTGTPDNVLPTATTYLRTYFFGGLFTVIYNACVGIFQAVGDSRRPLYYLIVASIVNVVLDIVFVVYMDMGVQGAALATVIAQGVSAVLAFTKLMRVDGPHRLRIKEIGINKATVLKVLNMGIPTGVQNSVISFANVIMQANINMFGSAAMAGNGAYSKIEGFAFLPIMSFSMALTTFVGQNLGAKEYDRVRKGAKFGLVSGIILAQITGIVIWTLAPVLISMFSDTPEVIAIGVERARIISLFYFLLSASHLLSGILRGLGKTKVPMYVMLVAWCLIRITYATVTLRFIPDIRVVFWAYPLTWAISTIAFIWYYKSHSNIESIQIA